MKYRDLVQFDPIDSVVQIKDADEAHKAQRLVETFIISDRMREQLTDLILPQLQFEEPTDTKGLFVVDNYGTGKSHLMAVLSALAEHGNLAASVTNNDVTEAAHAIADKFLVVRAEINSGMPLRQFVMGTLQDALAGHGIVKHPILFPFNINIPLRTLRAANWADVYRESTDIVALCGPM